MVFNQVMENLVEDHAMLNTESFLKGSEKS